MRVMAWRDPMARCMDSMDPGNTVWIVADNKPIDLLNKFRIGISETAVWHRFTGNVLIWKIKRFLKNVLISYFVQFCLMQMSLFAEKEFVMLVGVAFAL